MHRILSIGAAAAGALYLAAGISLLYFQDVFKAAYLGTMVEAVPVYPVQDVLQLAIVGIPCVALSILSMSDSLGDKRGTNMALVFYSSVMLVLGGVLFSLIGNISTMIVGRTQGTAGLANVSAVSAVFGYLQVLSALSLVLLLLRGAFGLGGNR